MCLCVLIGCQVFRCLCNIFSILYVTLLLFLVTFLCITLYKNYPFQIFFFLGLFINDHSLLKRAKTLISLFFDQDLLFYDKCKVEFNRPSCWLYSVPNLFIFQQLETLYLGGNHVRVVCVRVCEELLKCVQRSRDSQLDLAVACGFKPPD